MKFLIYLAMAAAGLSACSETTDPAGISDEQFIEAMVAMRHAARAAAPDEAAFAAVREQILADQSLTTDELAAYIAARSTDPGHLAEVWEEVARRLPEQEFR